MVLEEVHEVLKGFVKDKTPGPNGWSVNLFLVVFYIMGPNLVEVVNKTKITRKVPGALNATFIALIPKSDNPYSYKYFRHTSLCNLVYKIISNIIANRLKPMLSNFMSKK